MIKNTVLRKWHRDMGYFFIGLIISYCISGIAQNHRSSWNPKQYEYKSQAVSTRIDTLPKDKITEDLASQILKQNGVTTKVRGLRMEDNPKSVTAFFESGIMHIDLKTGQGKIEFMKLRPVLGHMGLLHTNSTFWWALYSDFFALGLISIAIMGLFMVKGKYGFRKWGFKLMLAGLVIPLIFLYIMS